MRAPSELNSNAGVNIVEQTLANQAHLHDDLRRKITYLRLSVTEVCNFRCDYCLPDGYQPSAARQASPELSLNEIAHLVSGLAELGVQKVRITGGEPTVRRDLPDIIEGISTTSGISKVALTTNGYKLSQRYQHWLDAGLQQINLSIDSFNRDVFAKITGHDMLPELMRGLDQLLAHDGVEVKINAVLKPQYAEENLFAALALLKDRPISYRFIELMQTNDNDNLFFSEHLRSRSLSAYLLNHGWQVKARAATDGPALTYRHPDYRGSLGIIAPYAAGFCESCNRIRVSAQGKLHLCLFDRVNHDLRPLLQNADSAPLKALLSDFIRHKPDHHYLHQQDSGIMKNLSIVGG